MTDLYTKAVEQLGHEAAAVRLAGLYALERLAQDNPGHRQTIVNVICAYLRMPFNPPPDGPRQDLTPAVPRAAIAGASAPASGRDSHEELQVRLTAQRILEEHLHDDRPPADRTAELAGPRFWEGMRIDLTGATLTTPNFRNCHVTEANFHRVAFTGDATFHGATFAGNADFNGATFTRDADFNGATFARNTGFNRATFTRDARFNGAAFTSGAYFHMTTFDKTAWFDKATFNGKTRFNRVTFTDVAGFYMAAFPQGVEFFDATAAPVNGHVWPDGWRLEVTFDGKGYLVADAVDEPGPVDAPDEKG
ncbi:pentapeptide repeat-containing protein [Streptosporangium sp. NPDC000239]|uniref:pentapeptide repeat-containing protein n=1 Tax=Streptosporangium sp. NPDC000239 TaxID=3154248 RepID=UPI00332408CB